MNAHAPSLAEVKSQLRLELVAAAVNSATYVNPLQFVTTWGRTDQGVEDAQMPIGAPILAPGPIKVLAIIPNWYAGQPLVYFELLNGPDAGRVQYVAEQITAIAPAGSTLRQGQAIARYAPSGTSIEYGWSTINGITLAKATTGYEGQVTPAGQSIRAWLDSLGANAELHRENPAAPGSVHIRQPSFQQIRIDLLRRVLLKPVACCGDHRVDAQIRHPALHRGGGHELPHGIALAGQKQRGLLDRAVSELCCPLPVAVDVAVQVQAAGEAGALKAST